MTLEEKMKFVLAHKNKPFEYSWSNMNTWVKVTYDEYLLTCIEFGLKMVGCDFREVKEEPQPYEKEYWHSSC